MAKLQYAPQSVEDYIHYVQDSYELLIWVGAKLIPFQITRNNYQWVLFPIQLSPGYYHIVMQVHQSDDLRPVTAYAVIFSPGSRSYENYPLSLTGLGYHHTPAMACSNSFLLVRNHAEYRTPLYVLHTLGVTTRDWMADVYQAHFEVSVLRDKRRFRSTTY